MPGENNNQNQTTPPAGTPPANNQGGNDPTNAQGQKQNESYVPLYKFQKANEQLKQYEQELAKFKELEKQKQERDLLEQKKYEELLQNKTLEVKKSEDLIKSLSDQLKQNKIMSTIIIELNKHNPYDAGDIIKLINLSDLTPEENGDIDVKQIEKVIEKMKKDKPFLFKSNSSGNINPDENNRANVSLESLEAEFKILNEKGVLNARERARFRDVANKLKELRSKTK